MQCGHFFSRSHKTIRWDERNTEVQCVGCNIFKHGNTAIYALRLQEKYGQGILKALEMSKNEQKVYTSKEFVDLIIYYKSKI